MSFDEKLKEGKIGESKIASWFMSRGYLVLPVYENTDSFKGPTVYSSNGQIISPDMLVFNDKKTFWVEAKHKSAFSWHRNSGRWTTGIDLKHYEDYCKLIALVNFPIWLLFLHKDGVAKDTPQGMTSPTGLFGGNLKTLLRNENHRSDRHANGMVYWNYMENNPLSQLKKITSYIE